jgi:hypothetical protein
MKRILCFALLIALISLFDPFGVLAAETAKPTETMNENESFGPFFTFTPSSSGDLIKSGSLTFTGAETFKAITLSSPAQITTSAQSFADALTETGFGFEFGNKFTDHIGLHVGVFFRNLSGESFNGFSVDAATTINFIGKGSLTSTGADTIRVKMDDANEWGIYSGIKIHPWVFEKFSFYLRGDTGILNSDDIKAQVSLSGNTSESIKIDFFEAKTLFFLRGGVGTEVRVGNFELQGEVRAEWRQERAVADEVRDLISSDPTLAFPLYFGVMWRF